MRWLMICAIFINSLLSGCSIPIHITYGKPKVMVRKIIRLKDSKKVMVRAIMIESGLSEPDATILWEKYKLSNIKGLANYLIQTNPYQKQDRVYIDFVERVKVRTKILKREGYAKQNFKNR